MRSITKTITIVLLLTTIFSGCRKETNEVNIGYVPVAYALPFFIAVDNGYFSEEGLNVKPVKFLTTNPMAEALIGGKIDGMMTASTTVCFAIEQNAPGMQKVFMIQATTKNFYMDFIVVKKDSSINDISQLKGKKIGVFPGSTIVTYAKIIFSHIGIDPDKDLELIQLDPQIQIEALSLGQVDALFTLEPIGTISIKKGIAKVLLTGALSYVMDPLPGGVYALSTKFVNENHENSLKIIRAMNKAIDFIRDNESEARKVLPKWTNLTTEFSSSFSLIQYWKLEEINKKSMQYLADLLYAKKDIYKKINTNLLYFEK